MKTNSDYYKSQLEKVKVGATEYSPTIKVFANGNGNDTKHIDLNNESATELIQWLNDNFINVQFELSHDGEPKYGGSENDCYMKLQRLQGQSANWAMKYEGWTIKPAKKITETAK